MCVRRERAIDVRWVGESYDIEKVSPVPEMDTGELELSMWSQSI